MEEGKAEDQGEKKTAEKSEEKTGGKKGLKEKPLEKMTVKELREIAMAISDITGVHGMKKADLLLAVQKARGMDVRPVKEKKDVSVLEIKKIIKKLKAERETARNVKDKKKVTVYRRRISRLKKKTRKAA